MESSVLDYVYPGDVTKKRMAVEFTGVNDCCRKKVQLRYVLGGKNDNIHVAASQFVRLASKLVQISEQILYSNPVYLTLDCAFARILLAPKPHRMREKISGSREKSRFTVGRPFV
jgi:hypothetical protein